MQQLCSESNNSFKDSYDISSILREASNLKETVRKLIKQKKQCENDIVKENVKVGLENSNESETIEEEIIEEITHFDINEKERDIAKLSGSKEKIIVDEIEMFNDNNYWHLNSDLLNKEFLNDVINEFDEKQI